MIDRDIDPVSGRPRRYDENGYGRTYVLMPPEPHLHSYDAWPPGWRSCRRAQHRPGEEPCDAPQVLDTRDDGMAILAVINEALREDWALPLFDFGAQPMVRLERAEGWREDGRLLVAVHDVTAHYCPSWDCRKTYALDEADWSDVLAKLTSKAYFPRGEPVLRGGRLA